MPSSRGIPAYVSGGWRIVIRCDTTCRNRGDDRELHARANPHEDFEMMPSTQSIDTLLFAFLDRVQERANNPQRNAAAEPRFVGLAPTRLEFAPGDVAILTVNSIEEKLLLAINMILDAKKHSSLPTLLFSAASSTDELATLLVGAVGRINLANLRSGNLEDEELPRLTEAIEGSRRLPLHVYFGSDLTMHKLQSVAGGLSRKLGAIGRLIVDVSCLAQWTRANRQFELVSSISRTGLLKALAIRRKCPVILLTHLVPQSHEGEHSRWWLKDLAAMGSPEDGSVISLQIYREPLIQNARAKRTGRSKG